ncbi:hypothetical protein BJF78_02375 [Pseudonocardia sp. CNS-139]|nr:hypothetical protein BJF78_02375 [Pseudonocardia sp. CNS-139]
MPHAAGRSDIREARRGVVPYLLTAPVVVALLAFVVLPAAFAVGLAFVRWDLLRGTVEFVGIENFATEIAGGELGRGVLVTVGYAVLTVPASLAGGLLVALGIDALSHGRAFWRAVYFLPVAATLVAMSIVWRWMFRPDTGVVDATVGRLTGLRDWLNSLELALPAVAAVGTWQQVGFVAVVYLAALTAVPRDVLEAARLDGAGALSRFRHVTWPALGPATVFAVVLTSTAALRVYDTIRTMTDGGPAGSTESLAFLLWRRGVAYFDVGAGATLTVALLVLAGLVTLLQVRVLGRGLERKGTR